MPTPRAAHWARETRPASQAGVVPERGRRGASSLPHGARPHGAVLRPPLRLGDTVPPCSHCRRVSPVSWPRPPAGAASGSDSNARSAPRPAAPEHLGRCSWGPRKVRALSLSPDCRLSPSLRGRPASSRMASVFRKEGSGQSPRPGRAHWPCPDPQAGRATHKRGHVSAPPHLRGPLPSKTTTTEMFSF